MRVYVHGGEKTGSAIDSEKSNAEMFINDIGHSISRYIFFANVIHTVSWKRYFQRRLPKSLLRKSIIAAAASKVELNDPIYRKARKWADLWIAPNRKQYDLFKSDNVQAFYLPHYIDENVFKKLDLSKRKIAELANIDYNIIAGKYVIGSFQRDTLGSDLISPKWQKNPELLVEIVSKLPDRSKFILILAGPRRHYIIRQCEKNSIPYLYVGKKPNPGIDDIKENTLPLKKMVYLYNLIDCYLVTSKSEGGPKSVLEASFSKTLILSTNVGVAPDILDKRCIIENINETIKTLADAIEGRNKEMIDELVYNNMSNANRMGSYDVVKSNWEKMYELIIK